jgi:hypothetical protein
MTIVAFRFLTASQIQDAFLVAKVEINSLKTTRKLVVIMEEEFRSRVKYILHL